MIAGSGADEAASGMKQCKSIGPSEVDRVSMDSLTGKERVFHLARYLSANFKNVGQSGRSVCPPPCRRNPSSPEISAASGAGSSAVPISFFPSRRYTAPAATHALNSPTGSDQRSCVPPVTKTGRGATSAINSCWSTGISSQWLAYLRKLPAIQWYSPAPQTDRKSVLEG